MLRANVLAGASLFAVLRGRWQDLLKDSPTATPFQTVEWQETWWKHFGGFREPQAFVAYEGDDLVGLMPLVRTLGICRTLRPMGVGPSDYLHPLCRAGYEDDVSQKLAESIGGANNVDLVDLHQIRESRSVAAYFDCRQIEQAKCLVLDLPKTFESYVANLGPSLRSDLLRLDKTLFRSGRAVIEEVSTEHIGLGMNVLFEQHRLRWRKRGMPGAFIGKSVQFHKQWADLASRNGWLRLSVLRLDGEPIGAIYAMALNNTIYYYQAGFDPSKGSASPGNLLIAHTIRRAIEQGLEHFDFMRGDEKYKRRWKPNNVYRNLRLIASSNGVLGNLGSCWNRVGSQVEGRVRAGLENRGLIG